MCGSDKAPLYSDGGPASLDGHDHLEVLRRTGLVPGVIGTLWVLCDLLAGVLLVGNRIAGVFLLGKRKALIRNFVEGIEVTGDEAVLPYTIPMPNDGVTSESASVLDFVKPGPP